MTTLTKKDLHIIFLSCKRFNNKSAGGIESMGRRIISGLVASNFSVALVSKDIFPTVFSKNYAKSTNISSKNNFFFLYTVKELLLSLFLIPFALEEIKRARKCGKAPVIFAFDDSYSSMPAFIASKLTRTPYVVQIHALYTKYISFFITNLTLQRLILKLYMVAINNAEAIVNINMETTSYFNIHSSLPKSKSKLVCSPIDTLLFSPNYIHRNAIRHELGVDSNTCVFGFVGRLSEEKNVKLLLTAYSEALKASLISSNSLIFIVGNGPLKENLIQLSAKLSISKNVVFAGFRDDIERVMNGIDILVLPSHVEGLSCVVLEAMSCGVPVICSKIPCHEELIKLANCGFLFDSSMIQELINHLSELSINPSLRSKFGTNGRKYIEKNHAIESIITDYQKILLSSVKNKNNRVKT